MVAVVSGSVLTALAGTALGGGIGYISASLVARRTALGQAGAKLRAAFAPELAIARTTPSDHWHSLTRLFDQKIDLPAKGLDDILRDAFERHAIAVEEYRFYVPYEEERGEGRLGIGFLRYTDVNGGPELCCKRVEAILKFTEQQSWWCRRLRRG